MQMLQPTQRAQLWPTQRVGHCCWIYTSGISEVSRASAGQLMSGSEKEEEVWLALILTADVSPQLWRMNFSTSVTSLINVSLHQDTGALRNP